MLSLPIRTSRARGIMSTYCSVVIPSQYSREEVLSSVIRISCRDTFDHLLGGNIVEIQVGMGPAGELRYPSYPEQIGTWIFLVIGAFQCYDKYMISSLKAEAVSIGKPKWWHTGLTTQATTTTSLKTQTSSEKNAVDGTARMANFSFTMVSDYYNQPRALALKSLSR